mgnify:CR=1 FL=1
MALASLIVSVLLGVIAAFGGLFAHQHRFPAHCRTMQVAALLNWVPVLGFMIPSWVSILRSGEIALTLIDLAPLVHGVLSLGVQALMTYTVFRVTRMEKPRQARPLMQVTLTLWILAVVGGIGLYLLLYRG